VLAVGAEALKGWDLLSEAVPNDGPLSCGSSAKNGWLGG
jgi:hypothetical protein